MCRSKDAGRTWEIGEIDGGDYPRSIVAEADGSLLIVRALDRRDSPNFRIDRSTDGGATWEFTEGVVDWNDTPAGEFSCIRLKDGRLLLALRRQLPDTEGEGLQDTFITDSSDDGKTWSKPWRMSNTGEIHAYLLELADGYQLGDASTDDTFAHLSIFVQRLVREDERELLSWNPMQDEAIFRVAAEISSSKSGVRQVMRVTPLKVGEMK